MLGAPRKTWFIQSKPPTGPYLYHHASFSALRRIVLRWAIEAPFGKQAVSLTTDAGRFLSPLPFFAVVTVDGVVRLPYEGWLKENAIPALYRTRNLELVESARSREYTVFEEDAVPPEYKHIMGWAVHHEMFIGENEYMVLAQHIDIVGADIFIHPAKLKRFKSGLDPLATQRIYSLEELVQ